MLSWAVGSVKSSQSVARRLGQRLFLGGKAQLVASEKPFGYVKGPPKVREEWPSNLSANIRRRVLGVGGSAPDNSGNALSGVGGEEGWRVVTDGWFQHMQSKANTMSVACSASDASGDSVGWSSERRGGFGLFAWSSSLRRLVVVNLLSHLRKASLEPICNSPCISM
jgi:hypothetical protein